MESCRRKKLKKKEGGGTRRWEEMERDVLVTIYMKLDIKDLMIGAPLCCSSWYKASKDPCLWSDVNLLHFGYSSSSRKLIEFVIGRSLGLLTCIKFPPCASVDHLLLVAQSCPNLKHFSLRIPTESILEGKHKICASIAKLKELEGMEVDEVFIVDDLTLKQISECCPNFVKLRVYNSVSKNTASLIATALPKLKMLDLSRTKIHRKDLLVIFKGCTELEKLDITGCGKVYGSDEILKIGRRRIKDFKWDNEINDSCEECEDSGYEGEYYWPCKHVIDDGWLTYIDGTIDLIEEMHPRDEEIIYEHPPFVDFVVDDDPNDEYWDYYCDGGITSDSDDSFRGDPYDYSML